MDPQVGAIEFRASSPYHGLFHSVSHQPESSAGEIRSGLDLGPAFKNRAGAQEEPPRNTHREIHIQTNTESEAERDEELELTPAQR